LIEWHQEVNNAPNVEHPNSETNHQSPNLRKKSSRIANHCGGIKYRDRKSAERRQSRGKHGTDILATTPDLSGDDEVGFAIQVKDYQGVISESPIKQIMSSRRKSEEIEK
jgi:hypothetical protein